MAKDSPLNIFYAAEKSKKPGSKTSNTMLPAAPVRNLAIEAMLERMNDMRKEIDDKLEALMTTNGVSKDALQRFLNNKQNFTTEQWEFLQQKNDEFSQKIWTAIADENTPPPSNVNPKATMKTEPATGTLPPAANGPASSTASPAPARKGKFSGSRRNWIPTG